MCPDPAPGITADYKRLAWTEEHCVSSWQIQYTRPEILSPHLTTAQKEIAIIVSNTNKDGAGMGRRWEWSLEGQKRSRPLQTKIRSAVVGNSRVVGGRDFRTVSVTKALPSA